MPTFLARNVMYRKIDSHDKVVEAFEIIKKYFAPLTKIPDTKILRDER
jgi:nucleoside-specific outer membrane channel protein Tsx